MLSEIKKEAVGTAYEQAARRVLREVYNMDKNNQDEVLVNGFNYTEAYVGLSGKFCAAVVIFTKDLHKFFGINIPSITCNIALHGEWEDPRMIKTRVDLEKADPSEAIKAFIAYDMLCAIHRQHQREEAHAFSQKFTHNTPIPTPDKAFNHSVHPLDDLRFTPAELCGWEILSENYIIVKIMMSMFGITPNPELVEQCHHNAKRHLVRHNEIRSGAALVEYIKDHRMTQIASVDAKIRKGSSAQRLANKVLEANPGLLALIR